MRRPKGIKRPPAQQRFAREVGNPRDSRGLYAAMRRFLDYRATLGSTEYAVYTLERHLRDFIEWADARSVTHPQHVTQAILERYRRWIHHYRKKDGEPLALGSQSAKLVPLKSFFKWLTRSGEIPANPAAELELPKRLRKLPRAVLTVEEVERIMAQADASKPVGLRDRAMMEVLYVTGMRRMEVINLQLGDVDFVRGVAMVREGKGGKDRMIPLGERAAYWVRQYLEHGREHLVWDQQDATLFLSVEGLPMSLGGFTQTVGRYVKNAAIGKSGSCHLFRHTMATLMLEGGADIRFIQAMLGHADLSTTQIYTQVAIKQLQKVHAETHPGALRRVKSVNAAADDANPHTEPESTPQALFDALDAEAQADGEA